MSKKLIAVILLIFVFVFSACSQKSTTGSNQQPQNSAMVGQTPDENYDNPDENSNIDSVDKNNNNNNNSNINSQENQDDEDRDDIKSEDTSSAPNSNDGNSVSQGLSNQKKEWYFNPNSNHTTPEVPGEVKKMLETYSGYYVGDTSSKTLYLTFDEGYENGYTPKILDILKQNDVKAAFFVVKPYITSQPDIVKRMVNEGHLVCNHSWHHPSMPTKTGDTEKFNLELTETAKAFKEVTGTDMPLFFRPPMGEYSEKSLSLTKNLGYKTIFWSFAHADWDVKNQPSVQKTHDIIMKRMHNGCIILLHAVSKSDTEALDSVIKDLKAEGYRFGTLDELK